MKNENTRQQKKANTRQAVLRAALDLIVEKGLDRVSLREIARRVKYSPAGLYEYFDGKDDILLALAHEGSKRLIDVFERLPKGQPPVEYLIQLCLAYVDFTIQNPGYIAVMNHLPSERRNLTQSVPSDSSYAILVQAVQNTIDSGDITPPADLDTDGITYSLWALIHGMGMLRLTHLRDFDADFDFANRRALEIFLRGLK